MSENRQRSAETGSSRKNGRFFKEYAEQFNCMPMAAHYALACLKMTREKGLLPILKNQSSNDLSMPPG
jgi:hypothetical protein